MAMEISEMAELYASLMDKQHVLCWGAILVAATAGVALILTLISFARYVDYGPKDAKLTGLYMTTGFFILLTIVELTVVSGHRPASSDYDKLCEAAYEFNWPDDYQAQGLRLKIVKLCMSEDKAVKLDGMVYLSRGKAKH